MIYTYNIGRWLDIFSESMIFLLYFLKLIIRKTSTNIYNHDYIIDSVSTTLLQLTR